MITNSSIVHLCPGDVTPASWWLHSAYHATTWGPFPDERRAWQFLFGRTATDSERDDERRIGWTVDMDRTHPGKRQAAA